jgi:Protein of unknown function (DUF4079)
MPIFHPFLAILVLGLTCWVAILGWRYRLTFSRERRLQHVYWGKFLLIALVIVWLGGLLGVVGANLPGVKPGRSGHFIVGTVLLVGYSVSGLLVLGHRQSTGVRRFHAVANTLLLGLLLYQGLLGVNRLYKFGFLAHIPQDQFTRSFLAIKFGLTSPPVTALNGQRYNWTSPQEGKAFGGTWKQDSATLLQADCACSGNALLDAITINNRFPLLVFNNPIFGNFNYRADFWIESGQVDQSAGLGFWIVNEKNYYMVSASALRQSITLARFNNGTRQVLASFPAIVKLRHWQTLNILIVKSEIQIMLEDQLLGQSHDEGWNTGKVGLGTKSDSITRFQNIMATSH